MSPHFTDAFKQSQKDVWGDAGYRSTIPSDTGADGTDLTPSPHCPGYPRIETKGNPDDIHTRGPPIDSVDSQNSLLTLGHEAEQVYAWHTENRRRILQTGAHI